MANVTFEIYAKYWPQTALDNWSAALRSVLDARGLTAATVAFVPNTLPSRITVTVSGVPGNVIVKHEDVVDRLNEQFGIGLRY